VLSTLRVDATTPRGAKAPHRGFATISSIKSPRPSSLALALELVQPVLDQTNIEGN
jgi:hypothetical protein